jgi:hypothetical protein
MTYENPWIYNGEIFDSPDIQDFFGFVYRIECTETSRSYLGRKYFWSFRKQKGKSRRTKQESDWKKYYGSCPELKEDVKKYGKDKFNRYILSLHETVGKTNYEETKQLFLNNVLIESLDNGVPRYYNSNILGRYFRKDYYEQGPIANDVSEQSG